ncbi:MAG TPA: long-chain fatty acid--CoA ligase [Terriglobales bacterium]|nr:long-chain fatty acid--CoA ligase [Terriglobales bacterium]
MASRAHWKTPESPGLTSLNELLLWCKRRGDEPRVCGKRRGRWEALTARGFYQQARALAAQLEAAPGEHVAILAESGPEWLVADFACLAAGVVDVPIYPTLTAEQIAYILRDCAAVGIFVSTAAQAAKVAAVRAELPALRWVLCFEDASWPERVRRAVGGSETEFDAQLAATPGERVATLLYTSGTTGVPKGAALTHANLCANLNVSTLDFHFAKFERRLSILPLAHITERHIAYVDMLYGEATFFAESMERVPENLLEVRPTLLVSVPRLFEKVAAGVRAKVASQSKLQQRVFAWAQGVGREMAPYRLAGTRASQIPWGLRLRAAAADGLVGRKLRARLGGRLDKIISGGAPLGKELAEFLLSLGVVVDEGYGLTETSPVIALNRPGGRRPGSIGRPLPNLEVRFAEDGELLVRGPSVFSGYYHLPEDTAAAFEGDWFRTGDIGFQDGDGFLYLTDRKKDLIKTSGGKFIAPQPIEAKLKASALVAEAVVVGDGRNYASVLLVPNWEALAAAGCACADRRAACADERVRTLFQAELDRVNAGLARFETLKKFALLPGEFTVASGELTPTIKVRRRAVEHNYRGVIDGLYREAPAAG